MEAGSSPPEKGLCCAVVPTLAVTALDEGISGLAHRADAVAATTPSCWCAGAQTSLISMCALCAAIRHVWSVSGARLLHANAPILRCPGD